MRPHIGFERRDVEIADENSSLAALAAKAREPRLHLFEEIELVAKLGIERRVRHIATGWHVDVVQSERLCVRGAAIERDRQMPRVTAPANIAALYLGERNAREDGDAVIALLSGDRDMVEAERAERQLGEEAVNAFDFLETENVGPLRAGQAFDEIETQADRVDVPGGEAKSHEEGPNRKSVFYATAGTQPDSQTISL